MEAAAAVAVAEGYRKRETRRQLGRRTTHRDGRGLLSEQNHRLDLLDCLCPSSQQNIIVRVGEASGSAAHTARSSSRIDFGLVKGIVYRYVFG